MMRNFITQPENEADEDALKYLNMKTDEGALNHFAGYAARRVL